MALMIFGLLWHALALTSMLLMAPYGKKWEGFYITLLLGPLGFFIVLVMRSNLEEERKAKAASSDVSS